MLARILDLLQAARHQVHNLPDPPAGSLPSRCGGARANAKSRGTSESGRCRALSVTGRSDADPGSWPLHCPETDFAFALVEGPMRFGPRLGALAAYLRNLLQELYGAVLSTSTVQIFCRRAARRRQVAPYPERRNPGPGPRDQPREHGWQSMTCNTVAANWCPGNRSRQFRFTLPIQLGGCLGLCQPPLFFQLAQKLLLSGFQNRGSPFILTHDLAGQCKGLYASFLEVFRLLSVELVIRRPSILAR